MAILALQLAANRHAKAGGNAGRRMRGTEGVVFALTPFGEAGISWEIVGDSVLSAKITVPFGSRAVIDFPVTSNSVL